jgi:hypothetical protein
MPNLAATAGDASVGHGQRVAHVIVGLTVGGAETTLRRLLLHGSDRSQTLVISLTEAGPIGE